MIKVFLTIPFGKTEAAKRRIPLTDSAREVLERRLIEARGVYLFPHRDSPNRPTWKVNNAHDATLKKCALRFRLYDLRHTFASRTAMSGVDRVTLAALLGHNRLQTVLRYAPAEEHKAKAIRRLESFSSERQIVEVPSSNQVQ